MWCLDPRLLRTRHDHLVVYKVCVSELRIIDTNSFGGQLSASSVNTSISTTILTSDVSNQCWVRYAELYDCLHFNSSSGCREHDVITASLSDTSYRFDFLVDRFSSLVKFL
jgi:hypothetical protein